MEATVLRQGVGAMIDRAETPSATAYSVIWKFQLAPKSISAPVMEFEPVCS